MKKLIAVLMVVVLCVSLCACGAKTAVIDEQLQGVWKYQVNETMEATYTFLDGTVSCVTSAFGVTLDPQEGAYEILDSTIVIWAGTEAETELFYEFENNVLSITTSDGGTIYKQ